VTVLNDLGKFYDTPGAFRVGPPSWLLKQQKKYLLKQRLNKPSMVRGYIDALHAKVSVCLYDVSGGFARRQ